MKQLHFTRFIGKAGQGHDTLSLVIALQFSSYFFLFHKAISNSLFSIVSEGRIWCLVRVYPALSGQHGHEQTGDKERRRQKRKEAYIGKPERTRRGKGAKKR